MLTLAFIGNLGPMEMILVGLIALLLFGKRLPEVARSLGKGLTEFKKGMNGIEDQVSSSVYSTPEPSNSSRPVAVEERVEPSAPKFDPPTSAPVEEAVASSQENSEIK